MKSQPDQPVSKTETIITDRCRLRFPQDSDIPHIWTATRTPHFNDGLSWDPPARIEDIREPFRKAQASWDTGDHYNWSIESKVGDDFIGWMSIRKEARDGEWSIGYWIHPEQQDHGYATECALALVEFGFSRLGAETVSASHASWNTASGHVLERIGMSYVRTNPEGFRKNDEWIETREYEVRRGQAGLPDSIER